MQDFRPVVNYLAVGMTDGRAMPEPLREVGERCDDFTRGKGPLHAHLQEIEAELAAFERLRRIAGRHNWAKEDGTLKEKLRRAAAAGDHEAAAAVAQEHSPESSAWNAPHRRLIPAAGHATSPCRHSLRCRRQAVNQRLKEISDGRKTRRVEGGKSTRC
jgi:hypothetical protein